MRARVINHEDDDSDRRYFMCYLFNPENPGASGGINALHRQVIGVLSKKQVTDWLKGNGIDCSSERQNRNFGRRE